MVCTQTSILGHPVGVLYLIYLCLTVELPPDLGVTDLEEDGDLPPPTVVELAGAG